MHEEMQKLLHEQVESLQGLHALNQMMDKELDLLLGEAQRKLAEVAEKKAEDWYQESDGGRAEHHRHEAHHRVRTIKHNLIKTIHTKLHGQVNLEGIHPEHRLERLEAKLRQRLKDEKQRLHQKVKDLHKQLGEHHKRLPKEEAEAYTPLLKKTKELHQHIQKHTLPPEAIEQELQALPSQLFAPYLRFA